jgi:hypothetical protein
VEFWIQVRSRLLVKRVSPRSVQLNPTETSDAAQEGRQGVAFVHLILAQVQSMVFQMPFYALISWFQVEEHMFQSVGMRGNCRQKPLSYPDGQQKRSCMAQLQA